MRAETFTVTESNGMVHKYQRIAKKDAKIEYITGHEIAILPCNANSDSPWVQPYYTSIDSINANGMDFEKMLMYFIAYNCNYQMGYYPKYFKEVHYETYS